VSEEEAVYAALLTPQGKFLHDLFIVADGDAFLLDCEQDRLDDLVKRLTLYRLRSKVQFEDRRDRQMVAAVVGAEPFAAVGLEPERGRVARFGDGIAFVDPRLTNMGARVILPQETAARAFEAAGIGQGSFADYERLRLSFSVPDGSRDIQVDKSFLLESNFEELHGVDFEKGCYVGQENTSRQKYRGSVRKRLMRFDVDGPLPEPGTPIRLADREVGTVRSAFDGMAMALIRLEYLDQAGSEGVPLTAGEATVRPVKPEWLA